MFCFVILVWVVVIWRVFFCNYAKVFFELMGCCDSGLDYCDLQWIVSILVWICCNLVWVFMICVGMFVILCGCCVFVDVCDLAWILLIWIGCV